MASAPPGLREAARDGAMPGAAGLDALMPPAMAGKAEDVGVAKAGMDGARTFVLAVLAGAFIALGAMFATTVTRRAARTSPFGVARLLAGLAFCLGLILVVVAGAELFTGNNLIVMAWASRRVTLGAAAAQLGDRLRRQPRRRASPRPLLVFARRQYEFGDGAVGVNAPCDRRTPRRASASARRSRWAMLCNALVCLAVWLSYSARTTDRQGPRDPVPDHRLRRRRLRAQRRQHVLPAAGAVRQERRDRRLLGTTGAAAATSRT